MANPLLTDEQNRRLANQNSTYNQIMQGFAPVQQPQEDSWLGGLSRGAKAGFGGVGAGLLHAGQAAFGTDGSLAAGFDAMAENNAQRREWDLADTLSLDYLTNPEGLAYGLGQIAGSMALPALFGAGVAAAVPTGGTSLLGTGALIGAAGAAPMAISEGGNTYAQGLQQGMTEDEAKKAGLTDAAIKLPFYMLSEGLSGKVAQGLISKGLLNAEGKSLGRRAAESGAKIFGNAANEAYEEGTENRSSAYALGDQRISSLGNIFNPFDWNEEDKAQAVGVFTPTLALGTLTGGAGHLRRRFDKKNSDVSEEIASEDGGTIEEAPTEENFWENKEAAKHSIQQAYADGLISKDDARVMLMKLNGEELGEADKKRLKAREKQVAAAIESRRIQGYNDELDNYANNREIGKEAFINAIGGQESGGDYGAVNGRTGASGKYQIMPENWPAWAEETGIGADAEMTPENQEIVARYKLGEYYDKYGARGAAIAWYAGEGALDYSEEALNRKQGNGDEPSINEYADSVLARMGNVADSARIDDSEENYFDESDSMGLPKLSAPTAKGFDVSHLVDEEAQDARELFGEKQNENLGKQNLGNDFFSNIKVEQDKRAKAIKDIARAVSQPNTFDELRNSIPSNYLEQMQKARAVVPVNNNAVGRPIPSQTGTALTMQRGRNGGLNTDELAIMQKYQGNPDAFNRQFKKSVEAVRDAVNRGDITPDVGRAYMQNLGNMYNTVAGTVQNDGVILQGQDPAIIKMLGNLRDKRRRGDTGALPRLLQENGNADRSAAFANIINARAAQKFDETETADKFKFVPQRQSMYDGALRRNLAAQDKVKAEEQPSVEPTGRNGAALDKRNMLDVTLPKVREQHKWDKEHKEYHAERYGESALPQNQLLSTDRAARRNMPKPGIEARSFINDRAEKKSARERMQDAIAFVWKDDPKHPLKACRRQLNMFRDMRKEYLQPIYDVMAEGAGNGVSRIPIIEFDNQHRGRFYRQSNNSPWYAKYFKEHKKKPTQKAMYDIAEEVAFGENADVGYYAGVQGKELEAIVAENHAQLDPINDYIQTYESLELRLKENPNYGKEQAERINKAEEERRAEKRNAGETASAESIQTEAKQPAESNQDEVNKKAPALAEGYTTESGRSLDEADENEFILHKGEKNFGEISKEVSAASGGELQRGYIRLKVGNASKGLIHAKKHESQATKAGYNSIEDMIYDVCQNFTDIYKQEPKIKGYRPTYILVKRDGKGTLNATSPVYFELQADGNGGYYVVITAIPKSEKSLQRQTKKETLLYSRPGIDSAATSNSSAVSHQGNNNVGVAQGVLPTSDTMSVSVTKSVAQPAENVKKLNLPKGTTAEVSIVGDNSNIIQVKFNGAQGKGTGGIMGRAGYKWKSDKQVWQARKTEKAMDVAEQLGYTEEAKPQERDYELERDELWDTFATKLGIDNILSVDKANEELKGVEGLHDGAIVYFNKDNRNYSIISFEDDAKMLELGYKYHVYEYGVNLVGTRVGSQKTVDEVIDYVKDKQKTETSTPAKAKPRADIFSKNPDALFNDKIMKDIASGLTPKQVTDIIQKMPKAEQNKTAKKQTQEPTPAEKQTQGTKEPAKRFDGERARKSLDALIGRKKKSEPQKNDVIPKSKFMNVFNEDELDAEIEKLKKELSKLSANPFFNPTLMKSAFKVGGIYLQKGVNRFTEWAGSVVSVAGEQVRPFLPAVWDALKRYPDNQKFNDDVMTAVMEYVGEGVDNGKSLSAIKREFADDYGDEYLGYVDAAFEGVKKYPTSDNVADVVESKQDNTEGGKENGNNEARSGSVFENQQSEPVQGAESSGETGRVSGQSDEQHERQVQQSENEPAEKRSGTRGSNGAGSVSAHSGQGENSTGAAGRGTVPLTPAQKADAKPSETPGHNYTVTKDSLGDGGVKTKYKNNVEAIKLLKQLEAEGRQATPAEQEILANYVGWGGLSPVFNINYNGEAIDSAWTKEAKELKELLTDEEYKAARASTTTAFYTPVSVIKNIYGALERLGFKGGKILEPSMGTGNFFGVMPESMRSKSSLNGVELDPLTGRIAKQLYQKANVEITGFEKAKFPDNYFDLAISNVPFGSFRLDDAKYNKYNLNIHNYFFAKAMDKVRPGGLVCFVTSTDTMQGRGDSAKLRALLKGKADLVGAIRLPDTTFKANANTEVTSDVIILQKRKDGAEPSKFTQDWLKTVPSGVKDNYNNDLAINEYFKKHPEMVLGELKSGGRYGSLVVDGKGVNIDKAMQKAIKKLPADIYEARTTNRNTNSIESAQKFLAPNNSREGAFIEKDGKVYRVQQAEMTELPKTAQKKAKEYVGLRDVAKRLLSEQINPATTDEQLAKTRAELNKVYDQFVEQYGPINDKKNIRALSLDPDYGILEAIEDYKVDPLTNKATVSKRAIFTQRTVNPVREVAHADNVNDALALSMSQTGGVDLGYMSKLMDGKDESSILKELGDRVYENPATDGIELAEAYLSGNVREKLEIAETAAKTDERFKKNVEALKKIQPKDLEPEDISVSLGAPWIPASDIQYFVGHLLGKDTYRVMDIQYIPAVGTWKVNWVKSGYSYATQQVKNGVAATQTWGTKYKDVKDLLEAALNQSTPTVTHKDADGKTYTDREETIAAQAKLREIQEEFKKWIWTDKERTNRLLAYYNRNFNNWVLRSYDGSALNFPGYSTAEPQLKQHQKDVVWRILQDGTCLMAHCVGAGKTWSMQTAAMELKRLGLANKSMFVIPNHMLQQFENEFRRIYPNAKLLTISSDTLPDVNIAGAAKMSKAKLAERKAEKNAKRQSVLGKIAAEDWDGIIISHNIFKRIPMSPEAYNRFYEQQIAEVEQAILDINATEGKSGNAIVKTLETTKKNLETKLKQNVNEEAKDIVIPFEQLGVDQIFVDEADQFKNLYFTTKMRNIAGMSQANSQRSMDMFMKTQYLMNANNGRGVVFATGTPISNTMAEMFTMLRYLDNKGLKEKNLGFFDNWAATFATKETTAELSPDGSGYRTVEKFTKFNNMPELTKMFRKVADVKKIEDLDLKIPKLKNGKPTVVEIPMNSALETYIKETAKERAAKIHNRAVDPQEDNMLKLTGDLRKASLDMRLVDPSVPASVAGGKIKAVVEHVADKYKETSDVNGVQLVFCDLSTPKGEKDKVNENDAVEDKEEAEDNSNITVYAEIKKGLIKKGIPADQIAFIHDAKTKTQKEQLFERCRQGQVRVLIGSTEKMGAGTNIQNKLVAEHHVDAPWRPRDIEQREGRILRQGNENEEVEIFNYVTKGSFDANMWEKLKNKATMIGQAMSGNLVQRSLEDADATVLSFAEVEALASGNPLMAERVMVNAKLTQMEALAENYRRDQEKNKRILATIPNNIRVAEANAEKARADIANRKDISGDNFSMVMGRNKTVYTKRTDAKAELERIASHYTNELGGVVAKAGGFDIRFRAIPAGKLFMSNDGKTAYKAAENTVRAEIVGEDTYFCEPTLGSIEHAIMHAPDKALETANKIIVSGKEEMKQLEAKINEPFKYADEYESLKKRSAEIEEALNKSSEQTSDTQYSVSSEAVQRAKEEVEAEIRAAFPNGKVEYVNGVPTITMPNGSKFQYSIRENIVVNAKEQRKADAAHGTSGARVQGFWKKFTGNGVQRMLAVSQNSERGTAFHEAMHAAIDLVLTEKEKNALYNYYEKKAKEQNRDVDEVIADAYRDWVLARQRKSGTMFGKLWRKVKDFCTRIKALFDKGAEVERIMQDIESGRVYERGTNNHSVTKRISFSKEEIQGQKGSGTTQVATTRTMYVKALKWLRNQYPEAKTVLDYGAGLGLGTDDMRSNNPDLNIDCYEPNPERWAGKQPPTYTNNTQINKDYDLILNTNVLNVVEKPIRDLIVKDIADHLNMGGKALITTRGWSNDVNAAKNFKPADEHHAIWINKGKNGYVFQKGFDGDELKNYIEELLGDEFVVEKTRPTFGKSSVTITRVKVQPNTSAKQLELFDTESYQEMPDAYKTLKGSVVKRSKYGVGKQMGSQVYLHKDYVSDVIPKKVWENALKVLDDADSGFEYNCVMYDTKTGNVRFDEAPDFDEAREPIVGDTITVKPDGTVKRGHSNYIWHHKWLWVKNDYQGFDVNQSKAWSNKWLGTLTETADGNGIERWNAQLDRFNLEHDGEEVHYSVASPKHKIANAFTNTERKGTIETAKDFIKEGFKDFRAHWLDKNDNLRKFDEITQMTGEMSLHQNVQNIPATAAGLLKSVCEGDAQSIKAANQHLKNVKMKHNVTLAMALNEINKDVMDKAHPKYLEANGFDSWQNAFGAYLGVERELEMSSIAKAQGETYKFSKGLTEAECRNFVANAPVQFRKAADMFYKVNDNVISIMEDAQVFSHDVAKALRTKHRKYCPLLRDFSDTAAADNFIGGLSAGGRGVGNVSIPLKAISIKGSERGVLNPLETVLKSYAMMINRAERNKVGLLAVKAAQTKQLHDLIKEVPEVVGKDGKVVNAVADPKNCIFTVLVNGKKKAYQTTQELYSPIVGYNLPAAGLTLEVARMTAQMLRTGATMSPSFIIRNLLRDTITAGFSSKNGFIPFVDTWRGFMALKNDPVLRAEFEAAGVGEFNFYGAKAQRIKSLDKMIGEHENLFKRIFGKMEEWSDIAESATRMGEFMLARKAGKSLEQAGHEAREVTVDFSKSGIYGEQINRYIPFFNACLQGGDKIYQLMREDPHGTMMKMFLTIVLPSALLYAFNRDKDWWKDLDPDIKNNYWCLSDKLRIPKPQEIGVLLGSGIEAFFEQASGRDKKAVSNVLDAFLDNMTPSIIPTLILPLVEWKTNYSYFRGQQLVSSKYQRMPDELQYNDYTSELSKGIGKVFKVSPMKIDNLVRGYTGTMGALLWSMAGEPFAKANNLPAKHFNEMLFVRDFNVTDANLSRPMNEFYGILDKANRQHAGYGVKGKPEAAVKGIRSAGSMISKIRKDIDKITHSNLTPERKRELIDKRKEKMNQIAKQATARYGKYFE